MGLIESVRGVLWARRRRPDQPAYLAALGHERFSPPELLQQAVECEQAGFDGVCCSDHLAPWWPPGEPAPAHCGNAWVWLGAAAQATREVSLGTGVTSVIHRYHPVVLAQQVATLETLAPGRVFLGAGSGEAMNEVPAGLDWPSPGEQLARTEEALTIVRRLLAGETVDFRGEFFRATGARLYTQLERRPPIYLSAFGPQAAAVAGRVADGVWTLADPRQAPAVIASYRRSCEEAGREPGEIILQALVAWADSDEAALAGAREWKATLVDAHYRDDVHDPARIRAAGEEVSDTTFTTLGVISGDPQTHVRKIRAMEQLGATAIVLMNVSGADPRGTIRAYREHVLPQLRE